MRIISYHTSIIQYHTSINIISLQYLIVLSSIFGFLRHVFLSKKKFNEDAKGRPSCPSRRHFRHLGSFAAG